MVLLQKWKVYFCFMLQLIIIIHGAPQSKEAVENPVDKYLIVQTFKTGYRATSFYDKPKLEDSETTFIEVITRKKFCELKCGYLFGAQLHLNLTRDLLTNRANWMVLTSDNVQDFLFVNEATIMVDSLFREIPEYMDEVWLLYAYAEKTRKFFQSIAWNDNVIKGSDIMKQNELMLEYVSLEIDTRIRTDCKFNNTFNMENESNQLYNRIQSIKNFSEDVVTVLDVIKENKTLLQNMFNENVKNGLIRSFDTPFTYDVLFFRRDYNFRCLISYFLIEYGNSDFILTVWPLIEGKYNNVFDEGLRGLQNLKIYQDMVFETINLILLQITWTFVHLLGGMMITDNDSAKKYARTYSTDILKHFLDDMSLNDNLFYKNLHECFTNVYLSKTYFEQNTIFDKIDGRINYYSRRLGFSITASRKSSKTIDEVLKTANGFIVKIRELIGNRTTIKLIKSFSDMVGEHSNSIEREILKDPRKWYCH